MSEYRNKQFVLTDMMHRNSCEHSLSSATDVDELITYLS